MLALSQNLSLLIGAIGGAVIVLVVVVGLNRRG